MLKRALGDYHLPRQTDSGPTECSHAGLRRSQCQVSGKKALKRNGSLFFESLTAYRGKERG